MTRLVELEKRYPDIPSAVLLKADLVFTGIQINESLVEAGRQSMPHFRTVEFGGKRCAIPYFVHIPDGRNSGEELLVLVRPNPASPYRMEKGPDGRHWFFENGQSVISLLNGWVELVIQESDNSNLQPCNLFDDVGFEYFFLCLFIHEIG